MLQRLGKIERSVSRRMTFILNKTDLRYVHGPCATELVHHAYQIIQIRASINDP